MMLTDPVSRRPIHQRNILTAGYLRDDGLWDIEGHLRDTKSYGFHNEDRGIIAAGEPLHDMYIRLTIDDEMMIVAAAAHTAYAPYRMCPAITDAYQALVGIRIAAGFSRAVRKNLGGVQGCTHLTEIVRILATVAIQTIRPENKQPLKDLPEGSVLQVSQQPMSDALRNSCHAFAPDSVVSRRLFGD